MKKETQREADETAVLDFAQQQSLAGADGWLQGRYYGDEGLHVAEMLSFNRVFDVCPFEVGASHAAERRQFAARRRRFLPLFELEELLRRPFNSLSNGEMRRVLFARTVLAGTKRIVLNDPLAGLDPERREKFKGIISALAREGVDVRMRCRNADEFPGASAPRRPKATPRRSAPERGGASAPGEPVVEIRDLSIRYGRRRLFSHFSWTVRKGERWVLRGPNGSGKTTLFALITGDSPLAYANDVRVFGVPRAPGHELRRIRRRIGAVSPEMQTYLGLGPNELLDAALAGEPELLLLDEPCLNLDAADARRALRRIAAWLKARPHVTAIAVAHRDDHVPPGFPLTLVLPTTRADGA